MEITALNFLVLALAAYGLTHIITTSVIADGFRQKVWAKFPPSTKIGFLITCNWCTGFWVGLGLIGAASILPQLTFVVSLVLAIYAVVGLISVWADR